MPVDISKLVQNLETRTVTVRGIPLTIRAITAARMVQIEAALPAPIAPDPSEEKHPAFRSLRHLHYARRCALIVGVSADIAGADGTTFEARWTQQPRQVEAYCDYILETLTEQEVMRLYKIVGDIGDSLSAPDGERIGSETKPGN